MSDAQVDRTEVDSQSELDSRWASKTNRSPRNPDESDRLNHNASHSKSPGRGKRGDRTRTFNPRRAPRGRAQKDSGDEDESPQAGKDDTSSKNFSQTAGNKGMSLEGSVDPNQSASSQSETSEDEEEDEDEGEDDDGGDDDENDNDDEDSDREGKDHENDQAHGDTRDIDTSISKHNRGRKQKPDQQKESQLKSNQKREPYVRKVELPREKLSAADLEAKMAAMALKNAQLMEQKKAADLDAAEYREIELKSQQAFEAQRDQQKAIDAVREVAAERKLKKSQGREWDFEKTEDDWNRSRPYTDSMTNPNPGRNSWYASKGSGYRGRPGRGPHNSSRGMGRGGKRGGRGMGSWHGQKTEHPQAESPDRSQALESRSTWDQDPVPS